VEKGIPALTDFAKNLGESLGPAFRQIFTIIREDVLPIIRAWYGFIVDVIIPGITSIVRPVFEGLVGAFNSIKNAVSANSAELKPLLNLFKSIAEFVRDDLAPILGGAFKLALQTIGTIVAGLVTGFSRLVGFITQTITKIKEFVEFVKNNPVTRFFFGDNNDKSLKAGGFIDETKAPVVPPTFFPTGPTGPVGPPNIVTSKFGGTRDIGGLSAMQQAAVLRSIELQAETQRLRDARAGITPKESNITVNVNGAIDPEGTARTIVETLNNSFYRGTGGANSLQIA
jgi:hypothetical protein